MVSIVLLNQKGGVGKTSTAHHLAGTLATDGPGRSCSSTTTSGASLNPRATREVETRQMSPDPKRACYSRREPVRG